MCYSYDKPTNRLKNCTEILHTSITQTCETMLYHDRTYEDIPYNIIQILANTVEAYQEILEYFRGSHGFSLVPIHAPPAKRDQMSGWGRSRGNPFIVDAELH